MAFWYLRSTGDRDTHHGHMRRGRVLAVCGVEFSPVRALTIRGPALPGKPSDPDQICPKCHHITLTDVAP